PGPPPAIFFARDSTDETHLRRHLYRPHRRAASRGGGASDRRGVTGLGEAAIGYWVGETAAAGIVKDLLQHIGRGQDPFRIEAIWSDMYDHSFWAKRGGPIVFAGISAIEMALWDIKGKALKLPVYELLGGKVRERVRLYANGWSFRASTPDEFAAAT